MSNDTKSFLMVLAMIFGVVLLAALYEVAGSWWGGVPGALLFLYGWEEFSKISNEEKKEKKAREEIEHERRLNRLRNEK